jgi:hypothetical protein
MQYVHMNEVVFDSTTLAFPGLGNCHGVVYVNEYGMFGYHAAGDKLNSAGKADAFALFIRNHTQGGGKGIGLYGYCPTNRNTSDKAHKEELKMIAAAIRFDGKLLGYRWPMEKLGWGTTYVECQFNGGVISTSIEGFNDRDPQTTSSAFNWVDHRTVAQFRGSRNPTEAAFTETVPRLSVPDDVITGVTRSGIAQFVQAQKL